ncbi:MAG: hypothetical protein COA96_15025 [SAR86 cluster bacterium]|uniref:Uncharacterized protein n=1 Tax=SAR86 cluster bacterium TaxID=2030880 RepID=A0A2A5ASD2_9GAMM|nr:MAG: hypothetical protein COA96_15025 [SAR86 cluster bacterium]
MGLFSFLKQNRIVTREELANVVFDSVKCVNIEECHHVSQLEKRILLTWLYYRELTLRDSALNPSGLSGVALELIKLLASDVKLELINMKGTSLEDINESLLETFSLAKIHFDRGDIDSVLKVLLNKDDMDMLKCMTLFKLEVEEKVKSHLIDITING